MVVYRERYFIYFYLIIIFKLNACLYERKPRSAEVVNKEIKTDNIHGLLIEGSKLIYCNANTIQDNFCFHVKKFTIAKNQSFHLFLHCLLVLLYLVICGISNLSNTFLCKVL